jgi:iron complex outermembrane receptor protein
LAQETLETVVVTATKAGEAKVGASRTEKSDIATQRTSTSDTARLLQDTPGVSLYGAGGVSSLPVIHGLADDRIRIQVDGMDLVAACPNHMNSALSYIDPTNVEIASVFAGITPVSVGGDSIAGTIQVKSRPPEFADDEESVLTKGHAGVFYRSNGNAYGGNVSATLATNRFNLRYSGATAQSDNYLSANNFKAAGPGTAGGKWLNGNDVGSTNYTSKNQDFGIAMQLEDHLIQLNVGSQNIGFEGFPNQRMDMTANTSTQVNIRYWGDFEWGSLETRFYDQTVNHEMNMGADRFTYGTLGMPMLTEAKTTGGTVQANIDYSLRDTARIGMEYQTYTLYDWWPQAGGMMGPNTFWNVDFGQRNRLDAYGEWEARWNTLWLTQLGLRGDIVHADAAPVQGYNSQALWAVDAAAFNALNRARTDRNWDMTALSRYTPNEERTFDFGYSRKSHSPNLYNLYPWSTQPMASLMNNFVGDGNGYIGNIALKPEVAHSLSGSSDWHDSNKESWNIKLTAYLTYVQDYIDAKRCDFGQCGGATNLNKTNGFVNLQYANHTARLYGFDLSGSMALAETANFGDFAGRGLFNYVRGQNLSTHDDLYNIMPPNFKLAVVQHFGNWTNTAEIQLVDAKTRVSRVRNEVPTPGYGLLNLRSRYDWKSITLDLSLENLLNQHYILPLGGAYVGQGASMTSNGIPWGIIVPGKGRSIDMALNVSFR